MSGSKRASATTLMFILPSGECSDWGGGKEGNVGAAMPSNLFELATYPSGANEIPCLQSQST